MNRFLGRSGATAFAVGAVLLFPACSRNPPREDQPNRANGPAAGSGKAMGAAKQHAVAEKPKKPIHVSGDVIGTLGAKGKVTSIFGWAWDPTQPDVPVAVDIYEGKTLLGTVLANKLRPDLVKLTKDNGKHGFSYPFPVDLRDGKPHSISARISGANIELRSSPQSLTFVPPSKTKTPPKDSTATKS